VRLVLISLVSATAAAGILTIAACRPGESAFGDDPRSTCGVVMCPPGYVCSPDQQCVSGTGGNGGGSGTSGAGFAQSANSATGSGGDDACPDVAISFEPVVPSVVLLIDQSGSMQANFPGGTRWTVLYDALMNPTTGVVKALQDQVRFGLALYTGHDDVAQCPALIQVTPPSLNNHSAIDAVYAPEDPGGDTPTGDSIDVIAPMLSGLAEPGPKMIILATDGEPDTCAVPNPQLGQPEAIAAAQAAYAAGVETVILAVGGQVSQTHQQDMANAGAGMAVPASCPPCAPTYQPSDPQAMADAFTSIINGARSCILTVDGELDPDQASKGKVWLNGILLAFEHPDGWKLLSATEIELLGKACDEIMDGGDDEVIGEFPCDAVIN
jgi:hypothetical protein